MPSSPKQDLLDRLLSHRTGRLIVLGLWLLPVAIVFSGLLDVRPEAPSLCPSQVALGLPCPGCGMTRSVASFYRLDFSASFWYNPLGIVAALLHVLLTVFLLLDIRNGTNRYQRFFPWFTRFSTKYWWVLVILTFCTWVWNFDKYMAL